MASKVTKELGSRRRQSAGLSMVGFVILLTSCTGSSTRNDEQIPVPQVTMPDGPRPTRCESVIVSEADSEQKVYRSFYIEIREDGSESIVNQIDGDTPCP